MKRIYKTTICQYNLYDIKMNREQLVSFMSRTFSLIKANEKEFKGIEEPLALFHNKTHKYSGIQFGMEHGSLSIRACGRNEIKALKTWFKLYRLHHDFTPRNMQQTEEKYTLDFLPYMQIYFVSDFLVNRDKQRQLKNNRNKEAVKRILSDYIMANFLPFFTHIGYLHKREQQEITVNVLDYEAQPGLHQVFNKGKRKSYDIVFETNVILPHLFRMGEATATGFGDVTWI